MLRITLPPLFQNAVSGRQAHCQRNIGNYCRARGRQPVGRVSDFLHKCYSRDSIFSAQGSQVTAALSKTLSPALDDLRVTTQGEIRKCVVLPLDFHISHQLPSLLIPSSLLKKEEEGKENDDDSNRLINFLICKVWKISHSP